MQPIETGDRATESSRTNVTTERATPGAADDGRGGAAERRAAHGRAADSDRVHPTDRTPTFPRLEPGVTLLSTADRARGALQSLVLDRLLVDDGPAVWVDARNHATTQQLASVAPSRQLLDRIRVARAFTPFQHYSIVEDLPSVVGAGAAHPDEEAESAGDELAPTDGPTNGPLPANELAGGSAPAAGPALLLAPAVDWFYRADELRAGEGREMLERVLARLGDLATAHDLPVLVTRHGAAGVGDVVAERADARLECSLTQFGPRFSGDGFETLLFDCGNGAVQTTLAFWRRLLRRRHAAGTAEPPTATADSRPTPTELAEVAARGSD